MQPKSSKKKGNPDSLNMQNWNAFYAMHPDENLIFPTDIYYANLAKRILPMLVKMRTSLACPNEVVMRMSLCLAAYFEDQISQLGLWAAFIHRYRELYGRWLPWYDTTEDYYEDEVNLQDVKFLIWIILVSTQGQDMTSPEHPAIEASAKRVFDLLMNEFERAPANEALVSFVYDEGLTKNFLSLKHLFTWMAKICYLMAVPTWHTEERNRIKDLIVSEDGLGFGLDSGSYLASSYFSMRMRFGPLALYPNEWYVLMRKQKGIEKDNDKILQIKSTPFYPFLVISADEKTLSLVSLHGDEYKVVANSFKDYKADTFQRGDLIMATLVRYKGKWWCNGLTAFITKAAKRPKDKNPWDELRGLRQRLMKDNFAFDLLHKFDIDYKPGINPGIKKRLNKAIADNNGKPLFYFPNTKAALEWEQKMIGEVNLETESDMEELIGQQPLMIYVAKDYNMLASKFVYTVNDSDNPYFNPEKAYQGNQLLFNIYGVPNECIAYLVEHNFLVDIGFSLDDDKKKDWNIIKKNLPFWATFIRQYPC